MRTVLAIVLTAALLGGLSNSPRPLLAQETPTDQPPSPTLEPTVPPTEPPVPTATPPPTEAPQPTAVAVASPTEAVGEDDGGNDSTPWIVIGIIAAAALVLVALIAGWFGRRGGQAAASSTSWQSRAGDAYGKAAALHDSIAVELTTSTPLSDEAASQQRWRDVQRRADDLTADLHVLETGPPNDQAAQSLRKMLGTLTALRAATMPQPPSQAAGPPSQQAPVTGAPQAPEPAAGAATPAERLADQIRQRLAEFDGDVRAFKELL